MTRHSFFRSLLWTVAIIAGSLAGNRAVADPIASVKPLRKLERDDAVAASKARDRGDLMRADMEKRMRTLGLQEAGAMQRHKLEGKEPSLEVVEIQNAATDVAKAYQEVIDRFPHTEIAAYCAMRLSGLHQRLGDVDEAVKLLEKTAEEFAGTSAEGNLVFSLGLIYAQGKNDDTQASKWFALVPVPPENSKPNQEQRLYLSAQQQLVKCDLKLNLDQRAEERVNAFKQAFPKFAVEMDRFYGFERMARSPSR